MIDYKLIGSRIKATRESKNMTQEILAEKANITIVYLSKIENGKVHPTLDVLDSLCVVLGCDLGSIFGGVSTNMAEYQQDRINKLFQSLTPEIKPIALSLVEQLTQIR